MNLIDFGRSTNPPRSYMEFIEDAQHFVAQRGLQWVIPVEPNGIASFESAWDIRDLTKSPKRNAIWLRDFALCSRTREAAVQAGWDVNGLPSGPLLPEVARDFMKALVAHRSKQGLGASGSVDLARGIRALFSVTLKAPWELTSQDFTRLLDLENVPPIALYLRSLIRTMNHHALSPHGPLRLEAVAERTRQMLTKLSERKESQKLPEMRALYELARIVFQEQPDSHQDLIRFALIRIGMLTGLRLGELIMLPEDCLRWQTNIDVVSGRPAGEVGGVSNSLGLRYFGEKREAGSPDLLVEDVQWLPERFHKAIVEAVEQVRKATQRLRTILKAQHARPELHSKSDLRRFKTVEGIHLDTSDMLFLVFYRHKGPLPAYIPDDAAVALPHASTIRQGLGSNIGPNPKSLYDKYSQEPDASEMAVNAHSLRHLMNTELFRRGVPDTIITEQFGRESIAQSYEYDHRSLSELLKFVSLPEDAKKAVRPGSPQELIAKMVVSGTLGDSHLVRSFKKIQSRDGDRVAFAYLAANADGFHVTPYGYCTNSFSLDPCARHLKCFDSCKHFAVGGAPTQRVALETLLASLKTMRTAATRKPIESIGRKNQIAHADRLIAGVQAALEAPPGSTPFPTGKDHSASLKDLLL